MATNKHHNPRSSGQKKSPESWGVCPPLFGQRYHLGLGLHRGVRRASSYEDSLGLLIHASVFRKCSIYCGGLDPSLVTQETWGLALAPPLTTYSERGHVLYVLPWLWTWAVSISCGDPASLRSTQFHGHSFLSNIVLLESHSS